MTEPILDESSDINSATRGTVHRPTTLATCTLVGCPPNPQIAEQYAASRERSDAAPGVRDGVADARQSWRAGADALLGGLSVVGGLGDHFDDLVGGVGDGRFLGFSL